jgi:hypothetical protein
MSMPPSCSRKALAVILALTVTPSAQAEERSRIPIAVIDFDYGDTSGEPRDQAAEHLARLQDFTANLRSDLDKTGIYRVVAIACPTRPCTAKEVDGEILFAAANAAGARLLLVGGVDKVSTLVQQANVRLVDVEANRLLDDRRLSFRGDSNEAWRRAEAFIVEKMTRQDLAQ